MKTEATGWFIVRRLATLTFCGLLAGASNLRAQGVPPPPTLADVRYGKYDRDVLDIYQVKTAKPAPVLIFFHGGGWLGGDKTRLEPDPILNPDAVLKKGIAVVSANYRFTTGTTPRPSQRRCWIQRASSNSCAAMRKNGTSIPIASRSRAVPPAR